MPTKPDVLPFLIDGAWCSGSGAPFDSINPADGSVSARIGTADNTDVDAAVRGAGSAQADPAWARLRPHLRARLLHAVADKIEAAQEELARAQMSDNGKTLRECRSQAAAAASVYRYYAAAVEAMESELTPQRGPSLTMTVYEPVGVVAAITPWNSPLTLEAQKLAPALAAGNAVVLKPSEVTPQTALIMGRLLLEAGVPPGIVNVVTGGAETGRALVDHPGIDLVSFTGGTVAGRHIAEAAGRRLCPVLLELGGKSPNMIFADAEIDTAVAFAARGIFGSGGQSCIAGSRVFVERSVYDGFLDAFIAEARAWRPGLPEDETVRIGPMASFAHRDNVAAAVDRARAEGAEILCGGGPPADPHLAAGAFFEPTVITGLSNRSETAQAEIFGPVCVVLPFDDEAELISQANDTVFGLAAAVWSGDAKKCWRVARAVRAGTVWINGYKDGSIATPFGGVKQSGVGREKGLMGLRVYCAPKGIHWRLED